MERMYHDEVYESATEEGKELYLRLYNLFNEAQKCLNEDNYKTFVSVFYNYIREKFNLPNKIFTMAKTEDGTVVFVLFPKEPDGNHYKTYYDEESKLIYILVDHINE
jgi:hypothetical protein